MEQRETIVPPADHVSRFNPNTPQVTICAFCQKDYAAVNEQVIKADREKKINFSHGYCARHFYEELKKAKIPDEAAAESVSRRKGQLAPDLAQHPELVKLYSQGIFTKVEAQKSQQQPPQAPAEQPDNQPPLQLTPLKERFQKLAGIIKN